MRKIEPMMIGTALAVTAEKGVREMKRRETTTKDSVRIGFRIDRELAKQLKIIAIEREQSVSLLLEKMIRDFIDSVTKK